MIHFLNWNGPFFGDEFVHFRVGGEYSTMWYPLPFHPWKKKILHLSLWNFPTKKTLLPGRACRRGLMTFLLNSPTNWRKFSWFYPTFIRNATQTWSLMFNGWFTWKSRKDRPLHSYSFRMGLEPEKSYSIGRALDSTALEKEMKRTWKPSLSCILPLPRMPVTTRIMNHF